MTVQTSKKALTGTLVVSAFLSGGWSQTAKANPVPFDFNAKDLQLNESAEVGVTTAPGITVSTEAVLAGTADVGYLIHQSAADDLAAAPDFSLQQSGAIDSDVFPAAFVGNGVPFFDPNALPEIQLSFVSPIEVEGTITAESQPESQPEILQPTTEVVEVAQADDEPLTSTPTAVPQSAFLNAEGKVDLDSSHLVPTSILPASSVHSMDWGQTTGSNRNLNFDATTILPAASQSEVEADIELAQDTTSDTFSPPSEEEIRQRLLIDPNESVDVDAPRPVPSSSFLTPSAYGADWGDYFLGGAGAAGGNLRDVDGSASLGFGVGDAVRNVGLEVSASIISLDGFAEDGTVGFKVHKVFPDANNLAVALGWSNPVKWGSANEDEEIFYGVATQQFALRPNRDNQMPLTVSAGVGTGTFRSAGAIAAGDNALNPFGSVSVRVIPQLSLTSSWTGSGLGVAASAAPFNLPVVFTAGVSDLTDNTAEGTRFQGSMGYSFSF